MQIKSQDQLIVHYIKKCHTILPVFRKQIKGNDFQWLETINSEMFGDANSLHALHIHATVDFKI